MGMTFTAHKDAFTEYDGTTFPERNDSFESPLNPSIFGSDSGRDSFCYLLTENWLGKRYIKELVVTEVVYQHGWWYRLSNGKKYDVKCLGKCIFLHDELDKAKEECIRINKMRKVKVKYY